MALNDLTIRTPMAHSSSEKDDLGPRPDRFNFAVDVVDQWASKSPNLKAMHWVSQKEDSVQILTYGYFSRRSCQISNLLQHLGTREGETLLMMLPRLPAWWEIALAAIRSGIILSPTPTLCIESDIKYRLNQTKATVFVGDSVSIKKFQNVRSQCPSVRKVIQVGGGPTFENVISFHGALESIDETSTFPSPQRSWDTPALTYFTSGTSGAPKMVRHNQVSYPYASQQVGKDWYRLAPGKTLWNTAEQGWAKAAWSFFGAWSCGATLFVHDDRGAFSAENVVGILNKYPINSLCAPPLAYRQLVLHHAQNLLSQHPPMALEHCVSAGEALNADVSRKWLSSTGVAIHEGYGQSETVLLCGNFAGSEVRPGSMGRPAIGVPLHIITADGQIAADDNEGDIAVLLRDGDKESPFFGLFDGYVAGDGTLSRREKTFGSGSRKTTWYLTGDRATRDRDGYFWFVGRADDVINSSGYRIGPFEVESTLKLHSAVSECAVTSSPDEVRGEVVKAFIALADGWQLRANDDLKRELQAFCKANAAPYKYPRKIDFISPDAFPKTTSGKIQRSKLRQMEWSQGAKSKL